jgi:DNA-binding transcriptional ArsR family regulator
MQKNYYAIIPANVRYDKDLSPNAKLLYGEITALCNEKGYCWASNSYFADLYGVTKTSISQWIKQLTEKGYINTELIYREGTKEILHRYIKIIEGGIQENLHTPTQENLKDNNTVFNNTINTTLDNKKHMSESSGETPKKKKPKKEKLPKSELDNEFEILWKAYPRKDGKKLAKAKYIKIREKGLYTFDVVHNGILRYAHKIKVENMSKEFIKMASTFFNQECFNDAHEIVTKRKKVADFVSYARQLEGNLNEFNRDCKTINDDPIQLPNGF